jgi:hypothetical protein
MKHDHANIDIQMDLFTKSTKEVHAVHANVEKTWENYPGPRAAMIAWGILQLLEKTGRLTQHPVKSLAA